MTSRQRLQSAISHSIPDRVPLDLGSSITGLTRASAEQLCRFLGIEQALKVKLLDTLLEFQLQFFDEFLSRVGGYIQVIMLGDDLGTQRAPLISPELYREIIKPRHKRLFEFIKSRSEAKIFLHSCGAIRPLIPDLIDAGVEILHPLQPLAWGMEHFELKKEYGNKLCFWGGIDIQSALRGSLQEVVFEVERRINALGQGGGYVLAPAHNIQPDVPPENIVEMFDHAIEVGRYVA